MLTMTKKYVKLDQLLQTALENGFFAGGAAAVCSPDSVLWRWRCGQRQKEPFPLPLLENTAFDLASLTKIVCTTLCACRLEERGLLDFDRPLGVYLEKPGNFSCSTVRQLLTHTAGFIAEERLRNKITKPAAAAGYILNSPLAYPAGTKTIYSCFGFIILGAVIEAVTKKSLDIVCAEEVTIRLGMKNTFFNPVKNAKTKDTKSASNTKTPVDNIFQDGFAATEYDEKTGKMLCGVVHDENARFLGGIAGNAGLFSTLGDIIKLAQMVLNEGRLPEGEPYLRPETIVLFHTNQTAGMQEARGIGFKLAEYNAEQFAGKKISRNSFGHTGFTGTSVLIDPERKIGVILLTNRVHPSREEKRLIDFRGYFHDAVAELIDTGYT